MDSVNAACINEVFTAATIPVMHPSFARLFSHAVVSTRGTPRQIVTLADLASALYESPQTINNWKSRGVSMAGAIKADKLLGIDVNFVMDGTDPNARVEGVLQAQAVSQASLNNGSQNDATRVEWGSMTYDELPEIFEVVVPDNAMADRVKKGYRVTFRKQRTARADQGILVVDAAGDWFFRAYIPMGGERFRAAPLNKDYGAPLDSEADGLQILGVRLWHTSDEEWG